MKYTKDQLLAILEWDRFNWSQSLRFWDKRIDFNSIKSSLEIGARNGGLSLWLSINGVKDIICSDYIDNKADASILHSRYGYDTVKYEVINAVSINKKNTFDLICFKSVLGGVGFNNNKTAQEIAINEMFLALKPGGYLVFAENLKGSVIHTFFREHFVGWGKMWRYLSLDELIEMTKVFETVTYKTCGFFGAFGRNGFQRQVLGYIDYIINPLKFRK